MFFFICCYAKGTLFFRKSYLLLESCLQLLDLLLQILTLLDVFFS